MRRNNRNQDYYQLKKRHYDREEEEYQQNRNYNRNNLNNQRPNRALRNFGNGQPRQNQKPDKFSVQNLRSLIQPLKKAEKQKKQDYKIDIAKNQSVPVKQSIPRGGKIYQPQYEQQKKVLDQQIEEYKSQAINSNSSQPRKSRKVSSNHSDDSDWIVRQQNKVQQKQQISSLSFSVDLPPQQITEQVVKVEQPKIQKEVIKEKKQVETAKQQIKKEKGFEQENKNTNQQKIEQVDKVQKKIVKIENSEMKIKIQNRIQNKINMKKQIKILQALNQSQDKKPNEFEKLIDAIDLVEQEQIDQVDKEQNLEKKSKEKQLEKINANKELIANLEKSTKKAKIFLTFLAMSNIQSFTIKEVELKQLDFSIRLDSDGRPKIKQSHNITTNQFAKYIKFMNTSHYFPKIGQYQQQAQHYVDVAENREFNSDQTNTIEFQFCQIKVPQDQSNIQNYNDKNLIVVTNVSLLCMICGTKNQIVVWQNDRTVSCSCKGNDCSEKIYGRISKVRTQIVDQ